MTSVLVFHEVDDVDHWLSSPKRSEVLGALNITVKTYTDPTGSNRVGLLLEVPDMGAFERLMESEASAEAMKFDGVRSDTVQILVASPVKSSWGAPEV